MEKQNKKIEKKVVEKKVEIVKKESTYKKKKLIKTIKNSHKSSEKEDWIALAECIRSDQVPASDVAKFFSNKRFYGWYKRKYLRY